MRSGSISSMKTALPCVPPRNDPRYEHTKTTSLLHKRHVTADTQPQLMFLLLLHLVGNNSRRLRRHYDTVHHKLARFRQRLTCRFALTNNTESTTFTFYFHVIRPLFQLFLDRQRGLHSSLEGSLFLQLTI